MNEIIININEANKAQKYQNENELFQIDAFKRVSEILKEHKVGNDTDDITDCRFHDTIFIDGDRGVGKTAFMINIENYYKNIAKIEKPNYIFLKPVDPTLLEHTEKFLSVVLARIVEYVNDNKNILDSSNIDKYYKSLENLSKSLSSIKTLPDDIGIDEIASNKSSLKLEQHSHDFFKEVCSIFNVDSIVMLIDDVDMAFDKGFDVLEVVRKYLASPFLIPIVAGDMKLYREIVETRFIDKIEFSKDVEILKNIKDIFNKGCEDNKEKNLNWDNSILSCNQEILIQNRKELLDKKKIINNLVEQYLEKIFSSEYHIKLKNIFTVIKQNNVYIKFDNQISVSFSEIKDFEIRHINFGINQVDFTYKVFSDNTRELMQYLFSKKNIYKIFFENLTYTTGNQEIKEVSYNKYHPQRVIKKYDKRIYDFIFNNNLYRDSLEITSKIYEYSKDKKQKELSSLTLNDSLSYNGNDYNIYKAFLGDFFKNSKLSVEKPSNKYVIETKNFDEIQSRLSSMDKFIIDLFVFNDFYTQHQTRNFIFAGKFIEMIIFTLSIQNKVNFDKNIFEKVSVELKKENFDSIIKKEYLSTYVSLFINADILNTSEDGIYYKNKLEKENKTDILEYMTLFKIDANLFELSEIVNKVPFNSDFSSNKRFFNQLNIENEENLDDLFLEYDIKTLNKSLIIWKNIFYRKVKLNSLSLYEILHKFFNNLVILKELDTNSTPLEFMQRIVIILINAVAYFENDDLRVANTNIATAKEFDIIRILSKTNASIKNIKPLLSVENSLTKALFYHPIIMNILFPSKNSELRNLNFVNTFSVSDFLKKIPRYNDGKAFTIDKKIEILESILEKEKIHLKKIYNFDEFKEKVLSPTNSSDKVKLSKLEDLNKIIEDKIK